MYLYNSPNGRLGNAVFRYFASIVFSIIYGGIIVDDINLMNKNYLIVNDSSFIIFMNNLMANKILNNTNNNYIFDGYFQHDNIYKIFKTKIVNYIENHPNDVLRCHDGDSYKSIDLLHSPKTFQIYDIVLHLRLEDFIKNGQVINPYCIKEILNNINTKNKTLCIVVNKPTSEIEKKYINYLNENNKFIIESNDIITDYHIMKNSKILICSCSTISWISSFLSTTIETVYFPNYKHEGRIHETFRKPIENTIYYNYKTCSKNELEILLKI